MHRQNRLCAGEPRRISGERKIMIGGVHREGSAHFPSQIRIQCVWRVRVSSSKRMFRCRLRKGKPERERERGTGGGTTVVAVAHKINQRPHTHPVQANHTHRDRPHSVKEEERGRNDGKKSR